MALAQWNHCGVGVDGEVLAGFWVESLRIFRPRSYALFALEIPWVWNTKVWRLPIDFYSIFVATFVFTFFCHLATRAAAGDEHASGAGT